MMRWKGWGSAIPQRLTLRSIERAAPVLSILLVLLIGYSVAQVIWRTWPTPPPVDAAPSAAAQAQPVAQAPVGMKIAEAHLFGVSEAEPGTQAPPETPLNFTLRGVFASENKAQAYAIIADAQGKEAGYPLGAELPDGVTLKEIYPDRVILSRGGRSETLSLPKEALTSGTAPLPGMIQPVPVPLPAAVEAVAAPAGGAENSALLRSYREALQANPQSLAGLIPLEPAEEAGVFSGYRLRGGGDPALLGRFGLAAGDVIAAVNGITLDSPAKGDEVLKSLATARTLDLLVLRNGEQKSFSYPVDE